MLRVVQALAVLVALGTWAGSLRAADVVVIASSDPSVEVGAVMDGSRPFTLAAAASVVLVSSQGRTIKLSGPYHGAPDPSPSRADGRLVESLSRLIAREASSPTTLAVFRGAVRHAPADRPDIWGIDIARAGNYCLRPDRPTTLWWAAARSGAIVTLSSRGAEAGSVRLRWPEGKRHLSWPRELILTDGAEFVARFWSGDDGEQLVTVLMPGLDTDAHRAAWMANHGCTRQALEVLDAMGKGEL